jgi:ATP-dependent Lon protease
MPGGRGFQITGSVGNVMQESARAALSYVRSRAESLHLPNEFFNKYDIHLHIPAGAQPKDGPSAGVTIATSLVSLISGRKVKPQVGMTGEITLRGQALAVGGIKEKILAAHRNGLTTVILPKRNEQDLDDVPEEIRNSMQFIFAESVEDVLNAALEEAKPDKKRPSKRAQRKARSAAPKTKTTKAKKNDKEKSAARGR